MKNAARYADTLRGLLRSFQKEGKVPPPEKQEPLQALVRGALSYDVPDARAEEAMKIIGREFVNLNELRVATILEIQDILGMRFPDIKARVDLITMGLNAVFEREHTLSLDRLRSLSRKDARQYLHDLPGMHPFVEAYVMLLALDGAAIPLDNESLIWLREQGLFDDKTTPADAQRFLESQVAADQCYEFFVGLRRTVFGRRRK
jgi:endonuclease III